MSKLIDYRDETPNDKSEDMLIVFRVEENEVVKKYGVWVDKVMARDEQILKPFLLKVADLADKNISVVNQERAYKIK